MPLAEMKERESDPKYRPEFERDIRQVQNEIENKVDINTETLGAAQSGGEAQVGVDVDDGDGDDEEDMALGD